MWIDGISELSPAAARPKPPGLHYHCWRPVLHLEPERWCHSKDRHTNPLCEGCALRGDAPGVE